MDSNNCFPFFCFFVLHNNKKKKCNTIKEKKNGIIYNSLGVSAAVSTLANAAEEATVVNEDTKEATLSGWEYTMVNTVTVAMMVNKCKAISPKILYTPSINPISDKTNKIIQIKYEKVSSQKEKVFTCNTIVYKIHDQIHWFGGLRFAFKLCMNHRI